MEQIEVLKAKMEKLFEEKNRIQNSLIEVEGAIKREFLKMPLIEGLAEYIKYQEYPTELYNSFGIDSGEHDSFGKARLKIVYDYGYTDVVGLTENEFSYLEELLNK